MQPAHARLSFNSPLSEERATALVERLAADSFVDLGCGWGELLLRLLAAYDDARGIGVDTDDAALDRARRQAVERGLAARVDFRSGDATKLDPRSAFSDQAAEVVLCVGSSHAWGDTASALRALRMTKARVLLGDAFWEKPPTPSLVETFGQLPDREGLVRQCESAGFRIQSIDGSTQAEWDAFESAWSDIDERRLAYQEGYRGVLGFAWLILD